MSELWEDEIIDSNLEEPLLARSAKNLSIAAFICSVTGALILIGSWFYASVNGDHPFSPSFALSTYAIALVPATGFILAIVSKRRAKKVNKRVPLATASTVIAPIALGYSLLPLLMGGLFDSFP